jgi:5-methyltetrahydrofolate--homocysteine methyltransferase
MMVEGGGFKVVDLGIDVSREKFVGGIRMHRPKVVCMSALLTTTMREMKSTLDFIRQLGLQGEVKIVIGDAPVTERFAKEIGCSRVCA